MTSFNCGRRCPCRCCRRGCITKAELGMVGVDDNWIEHCGTSMVAWQILFDDGDIVISPQSLLRSHPHPTTSQDEYIMKRK